MKDMSYGQGYKYSHDFQGVQNHQEFMPEALQGHPFYQPKPVGLEQKIRQYLERQWGDKYEGGKG
jgi:putative ATPase